MHTEVVKYSPGGIGNSGPLQGIAPNIGTKKTQRKKQKLITKNYKNCDFDKGKSLIINILRFSHQDVEELEWKDPLNKIIHVALYSCVIHRNYNPLSKLGGYIYTQINS